MSFIEQSNYFTPSHFILVTNEQLGSIDNSSNEALRPAACPRDPGILNSTTIDCTDKDLTRSRGQAAGLSVLNCQHAQ